MPLDRKRVIAAAILATLVPLAARPGIALTIGQVDTFEDGTTNGWTSGAANPVPPQNNASGGPAGVNDNFLLLNSLGGGGPGGRLVAFNFSQWAGDYVSAGAGAVSMDVNNYGASDLSLRLIFRDQAGANTAISQAVQVPAGSGWLHAEFAIGAADLVVLAGSATAALAATFEVRLAHSPQLELPPPPVAATLGVDNIALSAGGAAGVVEDPAVVPPATGLRSVHPNPFNPRVTVTYALDRELPARVSVHDAQGRLVRVLEEGVFPAGTRTVAWDGADRDGRRLASGAYIIEMIAGDARDRRVVTLLK